MVLALVLVLVGAKPAFAEDHVVLRRGADRFATLIAAGESALPSTAIVVGDAPASDGAAGAAFAATTGALFLLATPAGLRYDVAEHLRTHVRGGIVYVAGGTAAVSSDVDAQLRDLGYSVQRVAGVDRYDTAARLAELAAPESPQVILSSSADAASACVAATSGRGYAFLLTEGGRLPAPTAAYLERHDPDAIVAINDAAKAVDETKAISSAGASRTCVEIAHQLYARPGRFSLASAQHPADTFIAAAYTAVGAPLLLLADDDQETVVEYLRQQADDVAGGTAYGGTASLSDRALAEAEAAINGCPRGSPDVDQPFAPFEVTVTTDAANYPYQSPVQITVEACNRGADAYAQRHTDPLVTISVLTDAGTVVATEPDRVRSDVIQTRTWRPGECTIETSIQWDRHTGTTLTSEPHDDGPPASNGIYQVAANWSGVDGNPCHGRGARFTSERFAMD